MTVRVHVFSLTRRPGSAKPWYVRWRVGGRDRSRQFRTKAAAERFHAQLLIGADRGDPFDHASGLPASMIRPTAPEEPSAGAGSVYLQIVEFLAHKWAAWAATTRRSAVETLTIAIETLNSPAHGPHTLEDTHEPEMASWVHRWLTQQALINPTSPATAETLAVLLRDPRDRAAHTWLLMHSVRLADLSRRDAESVLDAFARRQDGTGKTAATVITRRRTQFGGFLKWAVRNELVISNPLDGSDWKPPLVNHEINADHVLALDQIPPLLDAVRRTGRSGPRLVAFFAIVAMAGLRPAEALALTSKDVELPHDGWGMIRVRSSLTNPGPRYTNDGSPTEQRPPKWRPWGATRHVPISPQLVGILRSHIHTFPPKPDGPIFTNTRGGRVDRGAYSRIFNAAKRYAFDPENPLQASTPYDLRHAHATHLLHAQVPLPEAARRLGHSPDVLLRIYAGITRHDQELGNLRMDQALETARQGSHP